MNWQQIDDCTIEAKGKYDTYAIYQDFGKECFELYLNDDPIPCGSYQDIESAKKDAEALENTPPEQKWWTRG